ncbi:MAG: bifunctional metallophosphatase/5'-nucleotidase [Desulfobacterales bacterium]|nr:bifunctional metallophosphatase/5'-nucleotidase [Desulfobacterales bacterium]
MGRKTKTKTIYVDVDDVLSKTTDTYMGVVEREFGKKRDYDDLVTFDLKKSFGLTNAEFDYFFDLVHTPDVLLGYAPVDGCVETLEHWAGQGHTIDIVTGRPSSAQGATLAWLDQCQIPFHSFTMVDKYNRPDADPAISISKAEFSRRSYDLAVEDSWDMAFYLAREMDVPVQLFHRPWNNRPLDHHRVTRIRSWDEIPSTP